MDTKKTLPRTCCLDYELMTTCQAFELHDWIKSEPLSDSIYLKMGQTTLTTEPSQMNLWKKVGKNDIEESKE